MRKAAGEGGFTLLELMISLFIFTIVSVIMVTALHSVLTSDAILKAKSARFQILSNTLILMSRDLEQIINRPITNAKGKVEAALIGTSTSVTFTHAGMFNPLVSKSTLERTQYLLLQRSLIRITWPVLDQAPKTQSDQRIIQPDVLQLQFSYLDAKGQFQNSWPPDNNAANVLPQAIKVSLTLANWGMLTQLYLIPGAAIEKLT